MATLNHVGKRLLLISVMMCLIFGVFCNMLPIENSKYQLSMETIYVLLSENNYVSAKEILLILDEEYEPSAEVYYLLAYITHRTYLINATMDSPDGFPPDIMTEHDVEYIDYLSKVVETDPLFEPGKISRMKDMNLLRAAQIELTSHYGLFASLDYFEKNYTQSRHYYQMGRQASGFYNALLEYNANIMNSCEPNAIVFTNGEMDTYPAWYLQMLPVEYIMEYTHEPTDIFISDQASLNLEKVQTEKNIHLQGMRRDITVANLPLLNTSWYVRHLRDIEGVEINWSEEEISSLDDRPGGFQKYLWNDFITYSAGDPAGTDQFTINYLQNVEDSELINAFYPQLGSDYCVLQIVKDNFGKRPIYFANNCESNFGFDSYMRNEGMVSRITSVKSEIGEESVDLQRLLTNIDKVYEYRTILDDTVYKDDYMVRLAMNYGSGYSRAALQFSKAGDHKKALAYAEQARKFIDSDLRLTEFWVHHYAATGQLDKLDEFINNTIMSHSAAIRIYNSYVLFTMAREFPRYFPRYMKKLLLAYPNEMDYAELALYYGHTYNLMSQVETILDSLMDESKLGYNYWDLNKRLGAMNEEGEAESP